MLSPLHYSWWHYNHGKAHQDYSTVIGYWLNIAEPVYVEGVAPDAKIVMIRTIYWTGGGVTGMVRMWIFNWDPIPKQLSISLTSRQ